MKLLFVYNAKTGFFNKSADWLHKAISPSTYACSLCSLSHTNFKEKEDWTNELGKLNEEIEFYYKDEFIKKYNLTNLEFPLVGTFINEGFKILLSSSEINQQENIKDFFTELNLKIKLVLNA